MKHFYPKALALLFTSLCAVSALAQSNQTFSVTTLNADGLPAKILFVSVNEEGPGEKYTRVISQYLTDHQVDFVGLQENFNFNDELYSVPVPSMTAMSSVAT
ncbi:MAG: hypothetical protein IJQ59_07835 [Bacteroidaceae bacterium]|nr:hypothetical protein [Bacteroidaceae bacterium]